MNPMEKTNPMEMCHTMMQGMFRMMQGMFRMMPGQPPGQSASYSSTSRVIDQVERPLISDDLSANPVRRLTEPSRTQKSLLPGSSTGAHGRVREIRRP
jgi:hypothetical protein